MTHGRRTRAGARRSGRLFHAMFHGHAAVMLLIDPESGLIIDANPAAAAFYGYPLHRLLGLPIGSINVLPPEQVARSRHDALRRARSRFVFPHRLADGTIRTVEVHSSPISYQGRRLLFSIVHDVTEQQAYEDRLREAAIVFDTTREAVAVTDPDGLVRQVNPAFAAVTGWPPEDLLGHPLHRIRIAPADPAEAASVGERMQDPNGFRGHVRGIGKDGVDRVHLLSVSPIRGPEGDTHGHVAVISDITALSRAKAELHRLAFEDTLTGLGNRRRLLAALDACTGAARADRPADAGDVDGAGGSGPAGAARGPAGAGATVCAVLHLDLDRFGAVNDGLGHAAGDEVLRQAAERLLAHCSPGALVARTGGDEFGILLPAGSDEAVARLAADAAVTALGPPFPVGADDEVSLTACVGIALATPEEPGIEALRHAAAALSEARRHGPGTIRAHRDELTRTSRRRLTLHARLRRALTADRLWLAYQPQVTVASGDVVGLEVLARWSDPDEGEIPPALFIPVAEESGLVVALGSWVLRTACAQAQEWIEAGLPPVRIAVNLSARQFDGGGLAREVTQVLAETGWPARRLELELTESALLRTGQATRAQLDQLTDVGVRFAIDDFGTGYSSLAYLKELPLTRLKIDRTFVDGVATDKDDRAIVAAVVAMGHHLGLEVLAEGVEEQAQRDYLLRQGCEEAQGYLFARPRPADAVPGLLLGPLGPPARST